MTNADFLKRMFSESWRWKVARVVEDLGDFIISIAVAIRNAPCQCKWCARNFEAIINDAEENAMEMACLKDQLDENLLMCEVEPR